jgi:hypothetical protein
MRIPKAGIAEGGVRRVKTAVWKFLKLKQTHRYDLDQIVQGLNDTGMPSLNNMSPNQAVDANQNDLFFFKYSKILNSPPDPKKMLKIGTLCRIKLRRSVGGDLATKEWAKPRFSEDIFRVIKASRANPVWMYRLESLDGQKIENKRFYREDLSIVVNA